MPLTKNIPQRSEGGADHAAAPTPAPASHPSNGRFGGAGACGETLVKKEEEEETLGQLRDRVVLASARAAAPGPRPAFVHIKVEDSSSGEESDGEGGGGEEATCGKGDGEGEKVEKEEEKDEDDEDDEEAEEEEEEEPRDLRAHAFGVGLKGGGEAVCPQSLTPGARSGPPGSPRARLRAPKMVADHTVQDNDAGEEEGGLPELVMRGGNGRATASRFKGVAWNKSASKWKAKCKGNHLGYHTTEEAAARAYSKYLDDGSVPEPAERGGCTSQFKGVSWSKSKNRWMAECKSMHLGHHATEADAARVQQIPRGRHRSCTSPRIQYLTVSGCQLEQE